MTNKSVLADGYYYHIFNRSIAGFKIFNNNNDFQKFIDTIRYYQFCNRPYKLSDFDTLSLLLQNKILTESDPNNKLATIISYCLMPTHFHLLLRQDQENGITKFLSDLQNSYSKHFNIKHNRKGPLWESRFRAVRVEDDEQLLHLTRYIHLNPTSANLVTNPQDWEYSSYKEYTDPVEIKGICEFKDVIDISPKNYKKFVDERKKYQQELSIIKAQLIDNYTG